MDDCLIVGGGVVGLSLAYLLAEGGRRVRVLDAGEAGREASWAGAGILPPANPRSRDPLAQLTALSNSLHAAWAERLREETGVDNGFRRCGGIYLARRGADAAELESQATAWQREGLEFERLTGAELGTLEPALSPAPPPTAAYLAPGECQLRNPRHLRALLAALSNRGVAIDERQAVVDFTVAGGRVREAITARSRFSAGAVCLTAGCWSGGLAERLGVRLAIKPIRGQIALLATPGPILQRVINEGKRYLVPRDDGRLLVGSTEEDVGFDRASTPRAIEELLRFAVSLAPALAEAPVERSWAGLRPATADGLPYLGRLPGLDNAYLCAGHFRSGLQLSSGSAQVMARLIAGEDPGIDLSAFGADRG